MLEKIRETVNSYEMLRPRDRVVLGLSGGADSVALLHVLLLLTEQYELSLFAVHVNHGLRGADADADEGFCADMCESLGVPLEIFRFDVKAYSEEKKISEEEAGRQLRYQTFERVTEAAGASRIAVAHNKNDNAETVLMHLCRGTGIKGLAGIPPVRGSVIRPLIEVPRIEIEEFLHVRGIPYRTDKSNSDNRYSRNKVRNIILPELVTAFGTGTLDGICRSSALLSAEERFLAHLTGLAYADCSEESAVSLEKLNRYDAVIQKRVLRMMCAHFAPGLTDISFAHTERLMGLMSAETGKVTELPGNIRATREYEHIRFYRPEHEESFCCDLIPDVEVFIENLGICVTASFTDLRNQKDFCEKNNIYCTKAFNYSKINNHIQIRSRHAGDRIFVKSMGGSKKHKNYFIDCKTPRNERDKTPLIADGNEILWIMDEKNITNDRYKENDGKIIYIHAGKKDIGKGDIIYGKDCIHDS